MDKGEIEQELFHLTNARLAKLEEHHVRQIDENRDTFRHLEKVEKENEGFRYRIMVLEKNYDIKLAQKESDINLSQEYDKNVHCPMCGK